MLAPIAPRSDRRPALRHARHGLSRWWCRALRLVERQHSDRSINDNLSRGTTFCFPLSSANQVRTSVGWVPEADPRRDLSSIFLSMGCRAYWGSDEGLRYYEAYHIRPRILQRLSTPWINSWLQKRIGAWFLVGKTKQRKDLVSWVCCLKSMTPGKHPERFVLNVCRV